MECKTNSLYVSVNLSYRFKLKVAYDLSINGLTYLDQVINRYVEIFWLSRPSFCTFCFSGFSFYGAVELPDETTKEACYEVTSWSCNANYGTIMFVLWFHGYIT